MYHLFLIILAIGLIAGLTNLDMLKGWLRTVVVIAATIIITLTSYQIGWVDGHVVGTFNVYQYHNPDEELGTVDRIEGGFVVIEQPEKCGDPIIIHESLLPDYVMEGDVIMRDLSINVQATFDKYIYNRRLLDLLE